MKRSIKSVAIACVLLVAISSGAAAAPRISLWLNGREIQSDVAPAIVGGRTLVPVRLISEMLGARVDWHEDTRSVSISAINNTDLKKQAELLGATTAAQNPVDAVNLWVEAALAGNGAIQYAVMSPELRKASLPGLEQSGWITGWPAGWAKNYVVKDESGGDAATRKFRLTFSGSDAGGNLASEDVILRVRLSRRADSSAAWVVDEISSAGTSGIPLIQWTESTVASDGARDVFDWVRGTWNVQTGRLEIGSENLARVQGPQQLLSWNGSSVIRLVPGAHEDVFTIDRVATGHTVDAVDRPVNAGGLVSGWLSDTSGDALATAQLVTASGRPKSVVLKAYLPAQTRVLEFDIAGTDAEALLRPVAVRGTVTEPKIIFETIHYTEDGMLCGLVEGSSTAKGTSWLTVASDLGVSEAGSGTQMYMSGGYVYVGVQGGKVKRVDITTGVISDMPLVNAAIARFQALHGYEMEAEVPPRFSSHGDILIVNWRPATVKSVQTPAGPGIESVAARLELAVRGDQVVAEIRNIDGNITTTKYDRVTGRFAYPKAPDHGFLFPDR